MNTLFNNPKETFYRVLSIVLSSLFFSFIPLLLFLIYMSHHSFFSYDFFSEGVFGLKVFFIFASLSVFLTSLALFGSIVPITKRYMLRKEQKIENEDKVALCVSIPINIFFIALFSYFAYVGEHGFRILYIFVITFFISLHLASLIHAKPSNQLKSLIGLICIITFMSLAFSKEASSALASGLRNYGVGGEINVALKPKFFNKTVIHGTLILLSPKYIYIKLNDSDDLSTIDRTHFDVITKTNYLRTEKDDKKNIKEKEK